MIRFRKLWVAIGLLTVLIAVGYSLAGTRSRLFNNIKDQDEALREHDSAWRQMGRGREISRLDLLMIMTRYHGKCLTSEPNWVSVNLDQRLDAGLRNRRTPIECRVQVRARFPDGIFKVLVWTLVLEAVSQENLKVVDVRRTSLI